MRKLFPKVIMLKEHNHIISIILLCYAAIKGNDCGD